MRTLRWLERRLDGDLSSPIDQRSEIIVVEIKGYGRSKDEKIFLSTESKNFIGTCSRRVFFGNWYHATEELRFESSNQLSENSIRKILFTFIRFISIGASRQYFSAGLTNGFKARWEIPRSSTYIEIISASNKSIYVARRAAQKGIFSTTFSQQSEQLIRKSSHGAGIYIVDSSMEFLDQGKKKFTSEMYSDFLSYGFQGLPSSEIPETMIVEDAKDLTSKLLSPSPVNKVVYVKNLIVSPHGDLFDTNLEGFTLELDDPISRVKSVNCNKDSQSKLCLKTSGKGLVRIEAASSFMPISENWAHFVEDNLPSLLRLTMDSGSREIYLLGSLSNHQAELLAVLFPDLEFVMMKVGCAYQFSDVLTVLHKDSRNELINGEVSDFPMIDFPAILELRRRFLELTRAWSAPNKRIFISRSLRGFRKLINLREVESELNRLGFQVVHPERLNLKSRVETFGNAEIIVGETGAGMVNCYFAPSGAQVLELRHPGTEYSNEHQASVLVTGHLYSQVLGSSPGILSKLRHGSDSYLIDLQALTKRLESM